MYIIIIGVLSGLSSMGRDVSSSALEVRVEAFAELLARDMFTLLDLCVSSLRRGHANLLCIAPMLTDDPRRESASTRHVVSQGTHEHTYSGVRGDGEVVQIRPVDLVHERLRLQLLVFGSFLTRSRNDKNT